jgi:large subunit ribosomal protein L11
LNIGIFEFWNFLIMAKKIKAILRLNIKAGEANPAPPVGPALGQYGVNIMDFCKQYNEKTQDKKGQIIPAVITIFEDRTFNFVTKLPPVSEMIKESLSLKKGSSTSGRETVGSLTRAQVEKIAKEKMQDLNTDNLEKAIKIVEGSAKSMGVKIE